MDGVVGKARTEDKFKIQEAYEQLDSRNKEKFNDYVRVLLLAQEREDQLILSAIQDRRKRAAVATILRFGEMDRAELLFGVGELVMNLPEEQLKKLVEILEARKE